MTMTPPPLAACAHWSVLVRDAQSGEVLLSHEPAAPLSTASVPKLLLLIACAVLIERDELDPTELLDRTAVPPVGDSGVWQHLDQPTLTVQDAARLVGIASDNLATNVLLQRIGLERVQREARRLAIDDVHLHDGVRDHRGPSDPPRLSTASATGLVDVMAQLGEGAVESAAVSDHVLGWMRHSADLSLVASAFGHDPLAHGTASLSAQLFVKTGTDDGVRADTGLVRSAHGSVAYAAIANWEPAPGSLDAVLASMRAIGELVRAHAELG